MEIKRKNKRLAAISIPRALFLFEMEIFINKMKKQICQIKTDRGIGTGFFCNLKYDEHNNLKVLITVNHLIKPKVGEIINFYIGGREYHKIKLDESRKVYTKNKDNLEQDSFLEIDNRIYENPDGFFNNEQIFLLYFNCSDKKWYFQLE